MVAVVIDEVADVVVSYVDVGAVVVSVVIDVVADVLLCVVDVVVVDGVIYTDNFVIVEGIIDAVTSACVVLTAIDFVAVVDVEGVIDVVTIFQL